MTDDIQEWVNGIYCGDSQEVLKKLPNNSVDLVITSPPYNVGVDYGEYDDDIAMAEYKLLIQDIFCKLNFVVKDSGRVCINVSLKNKNGVVDIPSIVKQKADIFDWNLRFEIVWNKGQSESSSAWGSWRSPSSPRPIFNHEYIFVFDISKEKKKHEKTLEKEKFMSLVKSVWNINPETESDHPASFPKEIPRRLIKLNSYKNDIVLDPFIGSGTTAVVAEQLDRDWIGIDLNKDYVDMSYDRIENETKKIFDDRSVFDY